MIRQHLIVDADDTLWENNIYFERAFEEFVAFLDHSSLGPPAVRDILDEMERVNAMIHGYGSLNFGRNLEQCYRRLVEREIREDDVRTVMGFAERGFRKRSATWRGGTISRCSPRAMWTNRSSRSIAPAWVDSSSTRPS
jgi:hypothetical protein